MRIHELTFLSLLSFVVPACQSSYQIEEEPPESSGDEGKDDQLDLTSTYYSVTRDSRECAWPACGGYIVKRVNKTSTLCRDGSHRPTCYVPLLSLATGVKNVDLRDGMVLRGTIADGVDSSFGKLGEFQATEVWAPLSKEESTESIYRLTFTPLACPQVNCPSFHRAKLNTTSSSDIHAVNAGPLAGVTQEEIDAAMAALQMVDTSGQPAKGILAAGVTMVSISDRSRQFVPSQLYKAITKAP